MNKSRGEIEIHTILSMENSTRSVGRMSGIAWSVAVVYSCALPTRRQRRVAKSRRRGALRAYDDQSRQRITSRRCKLDARCII